jgi:hypothetical protein
MKAPFLSICTLLLYAVHQDFWFWRTARPFVFGFLPVGLFYHACYCLLAAAWMIVLIRATWPSHLERESETSPEEPAR